MDNDQMPEMVLRVAENGSKILDTFTKAGVAWIGYKSANHWTGALAALISLRLATGGNLAAGVAGTGVLTAMGLSQIPQIQQLPETVLTPEFNPYFWTDLLKIPRSRLQP